MKKFYQRIIRYRRFILVFFIAAALICSLLRTMVAVNYDITKYLPADSISTVALEVMAEEFDGDIPNARVMVADVSIPQALEYKEALKKVTGVTAVIWLDDTVDIRVPLETIGADTVETYYNDGAALFTVTIDDENRIPAVEGIREIIGPENHMSGNAVSVAATTTNTIAEVQMIVVIAVLFVLAVLLLTTNSWLEPLLVLGGLGIAILINSGTNLIFGEISFVTNSAGSILQLAVSLDYSVFLLHRFEECRRTAETPAEAMTEALCKSTSSILSSGLTTVIGFLALVLMQFRLGYDMGLALAKGVALSLITVFIFMPALILAAYRLMDKTRHRSFMPGFRGFGKVVRAITIPLVCIFALVIVPSYLGSNANSYSYGTSEVFGEDTQVGKDIAAIEQIFGQQDTYVLLVPSGNTAAESVLSQELHNLPQVTGILSYVDTVGAEIPPEYLNEAALSQLQSDNYSRFLISVKVPYEGAETFELVNVIRTIAEERYPQSWYLAGSGVSTYDLMTTITADNVKVNLVAIAAVFLILLVTLKSIVLPFVLVLCIETAIWLNLSCPYFMDQTVFYVAYLIISSIQLGATVDYAILMTERYRENRRSIAKGAAVIQTVSDVAVSILTSGSALVVVGLLMGYISSNQLLAQLGIFIGRGTVFSLLIVFFVLPGLLYLFDGLISRRKRGGNK